MNVFKFTLFFLTLCATKSWGWGFFAHRQINRFAVFTLPPAMSKLYKYHIQFITENAVNPDKRRYVVKGEASKHYIDIDHYKDSALWKMPRYWKEAVEVYSEDILMQHGILPWHIYKMKHALTEAFREKDIYRILKLSADIGHYIADANVPLHTTENYNGQLTGQEGIHGLWETRLPELFSDNYDFWVGKAEYVENPQLRIWEAITNAHMEVDTVLWVEKKLSNNFPPAKKFSFERKGSSLKKVYSIAYARAYHTMLKGQVERQIRASIKMVGDFWFTCWLDAGQPNLDELIGLPLEEDRLKETFPKNKKLKVRTHED